MTTNNVHILAGNEPASRILLADRDPTESAIAIRAIKGRCARLEVWSVATLADAAEVVKSTLDGAIDKAKGDVDSMSEMGEMESLRLQMAMDRNAVAVRDQVPAVMGKLDVNALGGAASGVAGLYATAAIPARYAMERGAWK